MTKMIKKAVAGEKIGVECRRQELQIETGFSDNTVDMEDRYLGIFNCAVTYLWETKNPQTYIT